MAAPVDAQSSYLPEFNLPATSPGEAYGQALALSGDALIVADSKSNTVGFESGAAFVYTFQAATSSWVDAGILLGDDTVTGDNFGNALAIDGDLLVVGASRSNANGPSSGSAYIFRRIGPGNWIQEQKIIGGSAGTGAGFGFSVSIDNGRVFVAAPFESHAAARAGAIYVYEQVGPGWTESVRLTATDPTVDAFFGWDLDADGDRLVVGATGTDTFFNANSGAAYAFEEQAGTWTQQAKLASSTSGSGDAAGRQVAITGSQIFIGAPNNDVMGSDAGQVQRFSFVGGWFEQSSIYAPDATDNDRFGWNLGLADQELLVSTRGSLSPFTRPSEVYVFRTQGGLFVFSQDLDRRSAFPLAVHGSSTEGSQGRLATAVFGTDATTLFTPTTLNTGSTILFHDFDSTNLPAGVQESTTGLWTETNQCNPGGCFSGEHMYYGVPGACNFDVGLTQGQYSLSGLQLSADATHIRIRYRSYYMGEGLCDTFDQSRLFVDGVLVETTCSFEPAGTCESRELLVPLDLTSPTLTITWDFDSVDRFGNFHYGWSIDDILIEEVNAGLLDCNGNQVADQFDVASGRSLDANGNGIPDECEDQVLNYCGPANSNSSGGPAQMDFAGSTSLTADDLELRCTGAAPNNFGYFIMSEGQGFLPNFAGSQGNLCLAPPFIRINRASLGEVLFTGPSGEAGLAIQNDNLPATTIWLAGETWSFQFWFRDTNPTPTSNTSDGLQVLFQP